MNILGGEPPSLWGVMVWGVDEWGDTTDLITETTKVLEGSLTFADDTVLQPTIALDGETLTLSSDVTSLHLYDPAGYSYLFIPNTTDADDRVFASYTELGSESTTWTEDTTTSTEWSAA